VTGKAAATKVPVCFVYLVDLVYLVSFVQPKKPDRPDKPNNDLLMLEDFVNSLLVISL
jgi:hypothetical protein